MNEFLFTKIEKEYIGNIWFQQDSSTCHTAEAALNGLPGQKEAHIISRSDDVVWSPRSEFWSRGIIGPFFFENEQGEAVTANSDRYRAMLHKFLFTKIEEKDIVNIWFQQDGAT